MSHNPAAAGPPGDPSLSDRLRRHGEAVAAFIARARDISLAFAASPRAPGKWTPIQEAVHLALTYREFTAVFGGAPQFTLLVTPEQAAHFQRTVLPRILAGSWFPIGGAAPERTRPADGGLTMADALGRLEAAVERFHRACRAAAAADAGRTWTHPYFGPMSIPELVGLLTEHANHHARFLASSTPHAADGPPPLLRT